MKSGLTIREDNYNVVLDALKQLSGTDVLVGIPAGPPRDDAPLSNAELGYLQSTGATVEIDRRPLLCRQDHFWTWALRIPGIKRPSV